MDVGKRIKYFRMQKGITVNKLANIAGISQSYLRDIELGNKQPTVEYLEYICDAMHISLATFFDEQNDNQSSKASINNLNQKQLDALNNFINELLCDNTKYENKNR